MIHGAPDTRKAIDWKGVVAGIFIPLLTAFIWNAAVVIDPRMEKFFLPCDGYSYFFWIDIVFSYLVYFALRGTGKIFFNIFAYASFAAFLIAWALAVFIDGDYPYYCFGSIYRSFGWSPGCVVEDFLLTFIVCLFLISVFRYIMKRNKASLIRLR